MNESGRIDRLLAAATERLQEISESPRLDAELLLSRALDVSRSYLFAHPEDELDEQAFERFSRAVERRAEGVPLAYITGEKEFWSVCLHVNPDTLVPRPETEILVEQCLLRIPEDSQKRILELGTGSGAVAIVLARERPLCDIVATDISSAALDVAAENARQLSLPNIEFVEGNWCAAVTGRRFDLIVSNPPYVAQSDPELAMLRHEPPSALIAGSDGLDAIREIVTDVPAVLAPGGVLLLEHGSTQHEAVAALLRNDCWRDIGNHKDLAGLPRVTSACYFPD